MTQTKEQKTINNVYALMCVSLLMSFLPFMQAAILAMFMFAGAMITAYVIRRKVETESLTANHMTYLIRTIWIASLFAAITMVPAAAYVLAYYDPGPLDACTNEIMNAMHGGEYDPAMLENRMQPCMESFMAANQSVFLIGTFITAAPVVVYFGYRMAKGISRATKGHRIGNVKEWF